MCLTPNEKNKIVVIGDGIAAGFGDWITTGQNAGLTRRLKDKIAADESLLLSGKCLTVAILLQLQTNGCQTTFGPRCTCL